MQSEIISRTGKVHVPPTHESNTKGAGPSASSFKFRSFEESSKTGQLRPSDVSNLYPSELMYSGRPIKPIRRPYEIFLNACRPCGVNRSDAKVMFPLIQTTFLKRQALWHFMNTVLYDAACLEDATNMLETYFLDDRAKRVNN